MATPAAKSRRRAEALNRLDDLAVQVAEVFKAEVPDLRLTNRDPELAQIQQMEATADLLESILKASGGTETGPDADTVTDGDSLSDTHAADTSKASKKAAKKSAKKSRRK